MFHRGNSLYYVVSYVPTVRTRRYRFGMERGPYDVTVTADVMVPMRDGVSLATDIYLPANQFEPLPVVLLRTPYGKHLTEESNGWSSYFASNGYAAVVQDCRGCHG